MKDNRESRALFEHRDTNQQMLAGLESSERQANPTTFLIEKMCPQVSIFRKLLQSYTYEFRA